MVVRRRKKVTRYRAHTTHGGGHRKKRRGAGSRGGRGRAGTGKRAGHKRRVGLAQGAESRGFRARRTVALTKSINVGYFTIHRLEKLVAAGTAVKEGDMYVLDLARLGFQKLLGTGSVATKLKITVTSFSARAQEKIQSAGGEIVATAVAADAPANVEA